MDALKLYEDALDDLASDLITEDEFTKIIKCLRDVQEVKHGHWVTVELKNGRTEIYCSNCHWGCLYDEEGKYVKTPLCPHCGAKMDEEVNEDV